MAGLPGLAFCELIAETLAPAVPPRGVAELRERGVPVVPHGVGLSLGGVDPVDAARVTHLAACAEAVDAPLVSEHVAFVRAGGREAGHLLPVPRTREALDVLVANIRRTQAELDVPLALEPIAALFDWPENEFTEPDFLTELIERTDTLLLLDVANLYANARNRGQDPRAQLDRLPLDRIGYVHVAGGSEHDGLYQDTHTDPVPDAGARAARRAGGAAAGRAAGDAGTRRPLPAGRRADGRAGGGGRRGRPAAGQPIPTAPAPLLR